MSYTPNADELTEPTGDKSVKSSAPEHRAIKAKLARTLRVPEAGELADLPPAASRANQVLAFDSLGDPQLIPGVDSGSAADLALILADKTDLTKGATRVGFTPFVSGETPPTANTVQARIHRDYVYLSDFPGADPTGVADSRAAILTAKATGKAIRIDGEYLCVGDLPDIVNGMFGDSQRTSRLIVSASDLFTFSSTAVLDRRAARFEDFSVDSVGNNCDGKYVFKFPGVAAAAAPVYNSGVVIRGICVGRFSRMGGFGYFKDLFGLVVEDCVGTDLSQAFRIVGSVVQTEIRNFKSNNDSAAATLTKYGLSTESAVYAAGTMVPENLFVQGFKFIRCVRGISHAAGLMAHFIGLDTEADEIGAYLNAKCTLEKSLVAPSPSAAAWKGVFVGVSPATPADKILLEKNSISMLRAPSDPANSYGVDIGDGVSPVYRADVIQTTIEGVPNSLQIGIRGRDVRSGEVERSAIKTSVIIGNDIDITGRRLYINKNDITTDLGVTAGTIAVSDGGEATAHGEVKHNQCTTVTTTVTTPNNWDLMFNEPAVPTRRFVHMLTASGTWDPGAIANDGTANTTVTVVGAAVGDTAVAGFNPGAGNLLVSAHVQAADTVRVLILNKDGGAVDPVSQTLRVWVFKAA